MDKRTYAEKLKDPRWQKKRLEIFERDGWKCRRCGAEDQTLAVHHVKYVKDAEPWDYQGEDLLTLCENCHQEESEWRARSEQMLIDNLKLPGVFAVELQAFALCIELARLINENKKPCDGFMDALIASVYEYFEVAQKARKE